MPNLRLATFNCENLFSRAKVLNLADKSKAGDLLEAYAQLQRELDKPVYDKPKITQLLTKLKGYIDLHEVRKKLKGANGPNDWLGWVELKREETNADAVINTARVIADINADIVCLIEVENRPLLCRFHNDLLFDKFLSAQNKTAYTHIMLIDGNDDRGIDVSIVSRLPIRYLKSHVDEMIVDPSGKKVPVFSRDCLKVVIDIKLSNGMNKELHLFLNHFKSKGYSAPNDPQGGKRRKAQADKVADYISSYNLQQDYVAVLGDLNDIPSKPGKISSLDKLLSSGLYNVVENIQDPKERGTYGTQQIDYVLVSDPLKNALSAVEINRRGVFVKSQAKKQKNNTFPEVTSDITQASDHGAVVADFNL